MTIQTQGWGEFLKWTKQVNTGNNDTDVATQVLLLEVLLKLVNAAYEDTHVHKKELAKARTTKMQHISSKKIDGFSQTMNAYHGRTSIKQPPVQEVISPIMPISNNSRVIRKSNKPLPRNLLADFKMADGNTSIFTSLSESQGEEEEPSFTRADLLAIVRAKQLPQILESILSSVSGGASNNLVVEVYALTFRILKLVAHSIQLSYSKGEVFEMVSSEYHKYGVYAVLVGNIHLLCEAKMLEEVEILRCVIKTLEFISITPEGLDLLYDNCGTTMNIVNLCFIQN